MLADLILIGTPLVNGGIGLLVGRMADSMLAGVATFLGLHFLTLPWVKRFLGSRLPK
jgi:hypothetical protein